MEFKNEPTIRNATTDAARDISERRAATIAYMIDEAKKDGIDEKFARKAIYQYGMDMAIPMKEGMNDSTDMLEFSKYFGTDHNHDIYEMETIECNEDKLYIDFHYCPYVKKWIEQGRTPEEIANLCDITMEGDRAIGDCFDKFKFTLGKTIAQGHHVCEIRFDKGDKK